MVEQNLRAIVAKIAETTPDFPSTAHLRDDVGVDSVRAFEIVFEIEKVLGVAVPVERYSEVQTFEDLLAVVESLREK